MIIKQKVWQSSKWIDEDDKIILNPQLILVFGERTILSDKDYFNQLKTSYPSANIVISSTAGEIIGDKILENSITATIIEFEKTPILIEEFYIKNDKNSKSVGLEIAKRFNKKDLKGLFIISDGQLVNGDDLITGINEIIKGEIPVTGGLAGDNNRFEKTLVGLNKLPEQGNIIGIGFYGNSIKFGHGSRGGWDSFGPTRRITKSDRNNLFELDNNNALDLYKSYLGNQAKNLPGSALLFPLLLKDEKNTDGVVRTVLTVDENAKSMTFSGNLPVGSEVQLMKANFNKLIDGSKEAAKDSIELLKNPELAILISCVGRKLVLGQLTEEEIEEAVNQIGRPTYYTGFYSYGEISPSKQIKNCLLHNQTMTITTLREV